MQKMNIKLAIGNLLDFLCGARPVRRRRVPSPPRRDNRIVSPTCSAGCSAQASCPKCPIYQISRNVQS